MEASFCSLVSAGRGRSARPRQRHRERRVHDHPRLESEDHILDALRAYLPRSFRQLWPRSKRDGSEWLEVFMFDAPRKGECWFRSASRVPWFHRFSSVRRWPDAGFYAVALSLGSPLRRDKQQATLMPRGFSSERRHRASPRDPGSRRCRKSKDTKWGHLVPAACSKALGCGPLPRCVRFTSQLSIGIG